MAGEWLNAGLPRTPAQQGHSEVPMDFVQSFQPEQGPPLTRPETTAARTEVSASYLVRSDVVQRFRDFYRAQAGRFFAMPDPTWRDDSGDPDEVQARWMRPPRESQRVGDLVYVQCALELKR